MKKPYKPEKIKNVIKDVSLFEDGNAADVTDLLDFIFDKVYSEKMVIEELSPDEDEDKTISFKDEFDNKNTMYREAYDGINFDIIINRLFVGFYEREFKCANGHLKYSFLSEYKITFPLEQIDKKIKKNNNLDIYDCFNYYERMQSDDEIEECYKCGQKCILNEKIYRTPKILILILDRGKNKRFNKKIEYYKYIDLKKYIDDKSYEYPTKYRLLGISTHLGKTSQYGHYISFCLCDDNEYYCLNDSFVTKLQHNETYKLYEGSPYILFYQRIEKTNKANINEIIINIKNYIKSIIQEINFKKDDIHLFLENEKRIDRKEIKKYL
jgi:hypothetical protein